MIKGIIFDLDDTIISLKATANIMWRTMCKEYAEKNIIDAELLYATITTTRLTYWADQKTNALGRNNQKQARRDIIRKAFAKLDLNLADAVPFADDYSLRRMDALALFEGAKETLESLTNMGIKLALITNGQSEIQRIKINKFDLAKYFDCILIEGEQGYGKPDVRLYQQTLKAFKLEPEEVWSIGDHLEWDVQGPQLLGILGIWNDFESVGLSPNSAIQPDQIVHQISELIPMVERERNTSFQ